MAVVCTSCDHYISTEAEPFRPFRAEGAYRLVSSLGSLEKSLTEAGKTRIQLHQELFWRKSAPALVPHSLMAFRTTAADYITGLGHTCEHSRKPLAIFHYRICLGSHLRILAKHVDCLCPEPFGRIDATLILRVVYIVFLAFHIDLCSFLYSSMVLPEDEHRIRIVLEFRKHSKRSSCLVGESRSRSCRIESDSHHICSNIRSTFAECLLYAGFQDFQIVLRVLTPLVGLRNAVESLHPTWIILYGRSQDLTCLSVHDKSTCRICSVIQSYYIFIHIILAF